MTEESTLKPMPSANRESDLAHEHHLKQQLPYSQRLLQLLHMSEAERALKRKVVPIHKHSAWYYAGGLTLVFFAVQLITGILLLFYYQPSAEGAHKSVEMIMKEVPFGWLIRSVHAWSANALVLSMFIHMFSTFLMKSYRTPREILWITGILLFLIMLGFGFTGYLLPWDQTAYFATKVGTEVPKALPFVGDFMASLVRGSKEVTGSTLTRLFALHVGLLPLLAIILVGAHTMMTALFGSSVPVGTRVKKEVKFIPNYVLGEAVVWLVGFGVLLTVAILYPWQLGTAYDLSNPVEPPAGIHPEWYFMFLFQTLRYVPEWVAVVGFTLVLIFWTFVPWLDKRSKHHKKSPLFTWIGIVAIAYIVGLTVLAYMSVAEEQTAARAEQNAATSPEGPGIQPAPGPAPQPAPPHAK
ncbi:MAG: cytochrome bc complex cytochrome b subunit [Candidatus Kapaibacterium sp.]|jgi:cytochrome b6